MATESPEINLSNWRTSPANKHAFRHLDGLIPVKSIARSTQPKELKQASKSVSPELKIPISEQRSLSVQELLAATATDGIVVLHNGSLVFEHYANGNTKDSRHIVFSMTKSMTALVTGALVEQGLLKLDDLVPKHLPELIKSAYAEVTIRHLLDMRSGVIYDDATPAYRAACGWAPPEAGASKQSMLEFFSTFHPSDLDEPGSGFVYASVNTDVLGLVLERVSGKSLSELFHEYLWQPAGAETDAMMTVDSNGSARAAGGLCATVRDMARVGQGLLDGTVSSKAWVEDTLHGGDKEVFAASAWGPSFRAASTNLAYRSCWTVDDVAGFMLAMGIHGQMMFVDFKNNLILAKTSSQGERTDNMAWGLMFRLFRTIQASLEAQG